MVKEKEAQTNELVELAEQIEGFYFAIYTQGNEIAQSNIHRSDRTIPLACIPKNELRNCIVQN